MANIANDWPTRRSCSEDIRVAKSSVRSGSTTERSSRQLSGETLEQCVKRSLEQYFEDLGGAPPHALYELVTAAVERPLLQFAMTRSGGNQSAAAELLGINRNTLRKKLLQQRLS
jgi:Fis family transcriptional regulator